MRAQEQGGTPLRWAVMPPPGVLIVRTTCCCGARSCRRASSAAFGMCGLQLRCVCEPFESSLLVAESRGGARRAGWLAPDHSAAITGGLDR